MITTCPKCGRQLYFDTHTTALQYCPNCFPNCFPMTGGSYTISTGTTPDEKTLKKATGRTNKMTKYEKRIADRFGNLENYLLQQITNCSGGVLFPLARQRYTDQLEMVRLIKSVFEVSDKEDK